VCHLECCGDGIRSADARIMQIRGIESESCIDGLRSGVGMLPEFRTFHRLGVNSYGAKWWQRLRLF